MIRWEKPSLINLTAKTGVEGQLAECNDGSGNSYRCYTGNSAENKCESGNAAGQTCWAGNSAVDCNTGNTTVDS